VETSRTSGAMPHTAGAMPHATRAMLLPRGSNNRGNIAAVLIGVVLVTLAGPSHPPPLRHCISGGAASRCSRRNPRRGRNERECVEGVEDMAGADISGKIIAPHGESNKQAKQAKSK
jgi:hypothetical protein